MGENEEEIYFKKDEKTYIVYKNPNKELPGVGTIKYKDDGFYAGQIDNESLKPAGYGVYTLGDQYVCIGKFEKEGKGYGIITNPRNKDNYRGQLEHFKPGGLGVKQCGFADGNIYQGRTYTGNFTDGGTTLLGFSENKKRQKNKKTGKFLPKHFDEYELFQGTQTGKSVLGYMSLNGIGAHIFNDSNNKTYRWDKGNFTNGKLNGIGVRRNDQTYINYYYYSAKFEKDNIGKDAFKFDYSSIYPEDRYYPWVGNVITIRKVLDSIGNSSKLNFDAAEEKLKSTKFNASDAYTKADLAISLSNATPKNVDMSKMGIIELHKNKLNIYKGTVNNEKAYGYGTIEFPDNSVFTGSYVDDNNMLGKDLKSQNTGIFTIDGNGKLQFKKDIKEVEEIVVVVINKALLVKQAIEEEEKEKADKKKKEKKKKFADKLEEVKTRINEFNNLKYTQVTAEQGTIQTTNQTTYEGEKNKEGLPHGFGRMELNDGSNYEGQFVKGVAQGFGKYTYNVKTIEQVQQFFGLYNQEKKITYITTYTGEFNNGEPNGSGVIESGSEYIYEGDVLSFNYATKVLIRGFGYGTALIGGNQYTGEFKHYFYGLTHVVFEDTSTFDGWFAITAADIRGFGIRTYKNGDVYKGFCLRGQPRGMGVYIKKSGSKIWSENFKGDVVPDDGVQNDDMEQMIDDAIKEIMNETKLNEVQTKAKAAAEKAKAEKAKAEKEKDAAEKEKAEKAKDAAEKEKADKAKAEKEKAEKAADNAYADAIIRATPNGYDAKNVTTFKRPDGGANYVGHVRDGKPFGFGTMTYPNYCTYTGSFINNEPEGLGKIEYLENSGSPLKEYHGFVKGPSPHGYGLGVYKDDGQKEEYHVEWLNMKDTVLQGQQRYYNKEHDDKNPELLQKIKINIKRDAEKFVDMVPKVAEEEPSGSAKEESPKSGNLRGTKKESPKSGKLRGKLTPENTLSPQIDPVSTWGKKEYGLAAAAAGIGAAGIYYAFKNSKRKSKSKHRSKSKRRSKRERRSKSKDSSE